MSQVARVGQGEVSPRNAGNVPGQEGPAVARLGGQKRTVQQLHSVNAMNARIGAAQQRAAKAPLSDGFPLPAMVLFSVADGGEVEPEGMRELEAFKRQFEEASAAPAELRYTLMEYAANVILGLRRRAKWEPEVLLLLDIYLLRAEARFHELTGQPLFCGLVLFSGYPNMDGYRGFVDFNVLPWPDAWKRLRKEQEWFAQTNRPAALPLAPLPDEDAMTKLLTALASIQNALHQAWHFNDCTAYVLAAIELAHLQREFPKQCRGRLDKLVAMLAFDYEKMVGSRSGRKLFGGIKEKNMSVWFSSDPLDPQNQIDAKHTAIYSDSIHAIFHRFISGELDVLERSLTISLIVKRVVDVTPLPPPIGRIVGEYASNDADQKRQLSYLSLMIILLREGVPYETYQMFFNQLLQRTRERYQAVVQCPGGPIAPSLFGGAWENPENRHFIEFPNHPLIRQFMNNPTRNTTRFYELQVGEIGKGKVGQFIRECDEILNSDDPIEKQFHEIASRLETIQMSPLRLPYAVRAILEIYFIKLVLKFPQLRGGLMINNRLGLDWADDIKNVKDVSALQEAVLKDVCTLETFFEFIFV